MIAMEVLVRRRLSGRVLRLLAWVWLVANLLAMPGSAIGDRIGYAGMALACVWLLQGPWGRR